MSDSLFSQDCIHLHGCRQHNLKNLTFSIPKNALTVLIGVSGSGKSSIAFDTIFAEGQRRYLEHLSFQVRSRIKQLAKPQVDFIEGLSPTLAVGQKRSFDLFSRGTVATYTEIYDFLSLLYAKIGEQFSPVTGQKLTRYSRQEIINLILKDYSVGSKIQILSPIRLERENVNEAISRLQRMGYVRLRINDEEWTDEIPLPESMSKLDVIVDRLEMKEGIRERLASSIETALDLSQGIIKVQEGRSGPIKYFTEIFVCPETSLAFAPLEPVDFNFNSPRGACPACAGRGGQEEVDPALIFDQNESLIEQLRIIFDQIPKRISRSFQQFVQLFFEKEMIQEETTVGELPSSFLEKFLFGSSDVFEFISDSEHIKTTWQGLVHFLNRLIREKKGKDSLEEMPFISWKICPVCLGRGLKPESLACRIKNKSIDQLCQLTVSNLIEEIRSWKFEGKELLITKDILPAILTRLEFLKQVGLDYLELNRQGKSLSDGESHRIQLASQIGAKLSGIIYILDEPSLGLHRQDIEHLKTAIQELQGIGNTIVMVEHEPGLIEQANYVIELGPGAGEQGGKITFQGTYQQLIKDSGTITGDWISGRKTFPPPPQRKPKKNWLIIKDASLHNINHFSAKIPLGCLVGFCGVSGSGKSTLIFDLIGNEMIQYLNHRKTKPAFLEGYESIKRVVLSEKLAERFSSRSTPATYVDIMTPLRNLFAETRLAKARGYSSSRFSMNKKGGRCEACEGLGQLRMNMQLMPDLFIPCDVCQGLRYNYETLQVTWENHNVAEILAMSVDEAAIFFRHIPQLHPQLALMQELGLGYLTLGQPFHTLSGGEIQRLRLIADLMTKTTETTLYLLDEPSAGLHFEDIEKLLMILHRLVDKGHSIMLIEHHLGLLKQADWLIELGPGAGPSGGKLIFEGTASQLEKSSTPTGNVLRKMK